MLYLTRGIYSLSSQILLTDLLKNELVLTPKYISQIIFRLSDKIKDHYHHIPWVLTLIKTF